VRVGLLVLLLRVVATVAVEDLGHMMAEQV
jgi:hypothetical protein